MIEPSQLGARIVRATIVLAVLGWVLFGALGPALAHVDLASSDPSHEATVEGPVAEIRLEFTTAAEPAGDGIVLYGPSAESVPASVRAESDTVFVVVPQVPLESGRWAVAWTMRAGDAHPRAGGIEFVVGEAIIGSEANPVVPASQPSLLDEVVSEQSAFGGLIASIGRIATLLGALFGIGSLVFALLVFEGSAAEGRVIGYWVRRAGAAVLVGVPLEVAGASIAAEGGLVAGLSPPALLQALSGAFGIAVLLRLFGGGALLAGTRLATTPVANREWTGMAPEPGSVLAPARTRFHLAASPGAIVGAGAVALAFLFDGHTATVQPNAVMKLAALVHVVAGATWIAGVALLARLLVGRHQRGEPMQPARIVIPFSVVAGVSVAMVGVAGGVLALSIADGLATFFTTAWGRALLMKLLLAGAAGAIGAYNHRVIVPRLRKDPEDSWGSDSLRRTIRIEATLLLGVAAVTAVMVGLAAG